MQLNISGQYKYIAREREKLKKIVDKIDQRFILLGKQLQYANDIKIARSQKRAIPLEKVLHELGL